MAKNNGYDLTGQRFGKLVVIGRGESKGYGRTTWTCICDCGTKKDIRGDALKSGASKSCGSCKRFEKSLFTMVPIPINQICCEAKKAGLTFGQYVSKKYSLKMSERSIQYGNDKSRNRGAYK